MKTKDLFKNEGRAVVLSKFCLEMIEVYNFIENLNISLHLLKLTVYSSFLPLPFPPFDNEGRLVMFQSLFLSSILFLSFPDLVKHDIDETKKKMSSFLLDVFCFVFIEFNWGDLG